MEPAGFLTDIVDALPARTILARFSEPTNEGFVGYR